MRLTNTLDNPPRWFPIADAGVTSNNVLIVDYPRQSCGATPGITGQGDTMNAHDTQLHRRKRGRRNATVAAWRVPKLDRSIFREQEARQGMSWDCEHKHVSFLSGSHAIGSGISYRHDVSICLDCGEFRVFGYKNGERFDITFHLVTEEAIAAAGKYLEAIREDERARKIATDDETRR